MFKKINLFSKTEDKIFKYLLAHDQEKYEREIARETKTSPASVNNILRKFEKLELVKRVVKGRMKFYRKNEENPKIRQYKIILTMEVLEPILEKLKEISSLVILFGSCSEGTDSEESDIDLFVISDKREAVKEILRANKKINAIILTAEEYAELRERDKPLYERIEKGKELWRDKYD